MSCVLWESKRSCPNLPMMSTEPQSRRVIANCVLGHHGSLQPGKGACDELIGSGLAENPILDHMLFPQVKEMSEELQQEARRAEHVTNRQSRLVMCSSRGNLFLDSSSLSYVHVGCGAFELQLDANHEPHEHEGPGHKTHAVYSRPIRTFGRLVA